MTNVLLNLLGLILTVVSAFLMWLYPPRMRYFTEEGSQVVQFINNARLENEAIGKRQAILSKIAPLLLALGFGLQLPLAIVSLLQAR